jgi:hypothetical protein
MQRGIDVTDRRFVQGQREYNEVDLFLEDVVSSDRRIPLATNPRICKLCLVDVPMEQG